jgi:hypothetical protein
MIPPGMPHKTKFHRSFTGQRRFPMQSLNDGSTRTADEPLTRVGRRTNRSLTTLSTSQRRWISSIVCVLVNILLLTTVRVAPAFATECLDEPYSSLVRRSKIIVDVVVTEAFQSPDEGYGAIVRLVKLRKGRIDLKRFAVWTAYPPDGTIPTPDHFFFGVEDIGGRFRIYSDFVYRQGVKPLAGTPSRLILGRCSGTRRMTY